jgi:hypothetical protein
MTAWTVLMILAVIAGFYILMKRAEHRMAEGISRDLGVDGGMTEDERQRFIEYMDREIEANQ